MIRVFVGTRVVCYGGIGVRRRVRRRIPAGAVSGRGVACSDVELLCTLDYR